MYFSGESLSSLLSRSIQVSHALKLSEQSRFKIQKIFDSAIGGGDIDFGYSEFDLETITELLEVSGVVLRSISEHPSWGLLLDPFERVQFCPDCVRDDLKIIRSPVWRLNWGYPYYTVCEVHGCPLQVLAGEYSCNNPIYRLDYASRFIVDNDARLLNNFSARGDNNPRLSNQEQLKILIVDSARNVQNQIFEWQKQAANESLYVFFKLFTVVLRAYRRRIEAPPYCYQLTKQLLRENVAPLAAYDTLVHNLFYGHQKATSIYSRMIGLVVVAVMLNVKTARCQWEFICSLFSKIGILVPNKPEWLFTACTGTADQGLRDWLIQNKCDVFALMEISQKGIT